MRQRPNDRAGFRVNKLRVDLFQGGPNLIGQVLVFQLGKKSQQGRIAKSHRVRVAFAEFFKVCTDFHTMAHQLLETTGARQVAHTTQPDAN